MASLPANLMKRLRNVLKSFFISSKLSKNSCSSLFFQSKWGHHYFSEDTNYFSEGMMKHTTSFSPHKSQHCYFFMPASFLSLPSIIIASEIIECLMMSWENMLTFCEEIPMNVLFCKKNEMPLWFFWPLHWSLLAIYLVISWVLVMCWKTKYWTMNLMFSTIILMLGLWTDWGIDVQHFDFGPLCWTVCTFIIFCWYLISIGSTNCCCFSCKMSLNVDQWNEIQYHANSMKPFASFMKPFASFMKLIDCFKSELNSNESPSKRTCCFCFWKLVHLFLHFVFNVDIGSLFLLSLLIIALSCKMGSIVNFTSQLYCYIISHCSSYWDIL